MSLDFYHRREYRQDGFVYLLDDEEKTAWIKKGHIKRCRRYRLPDHVMIDGVRYTIESVEINAFNTPRTLRHLVVPDCYIYVDGDVFCFCPNLRSVHIGKGVEYLDHDNFRRCPKLRVYHIDKGNPHLMKRDGMIFSKDGKELLGEIVDRPHVIIPEGVEVINQCAFYYSNKLETIQFPTTLRRIGDNSFSGCPKLRKVVMPEGLEECEVQSFMENENLEYIDFPSTVYNISSHLAPFADCPNLRTVILRMPYVPQQFKNAYDFDGVDMEKCKLFVPSDLVEQYQQHPIWGMFKNILPIEN